MDNDSKFDGYANNYDAALNEGLSATGQTKDFFARERIIWLARCLERLNAKPAQIMDYGCGTGSATPFLHEFMRPECTVGVDTSEKSLEVARRQYPGTSSRFLLNGDYTPSTNIDLVYCNGVFHHIPPAVRAVHLRYIRDCLRPGGLFAFWENNPWNPGTRYVMSRIPFDRDAITLTPPEGRGLLRRAGFRILRTDYRFFFPGWLQGLRRTERFLNWFPLGGQYMVLARKPTEN